MAQALEDKKQVVADLNQLAQQAHSALAVNYHYLTVVEMTELRAQAKKQNVYVRVVKNTLARRALQGTDYQCMCDHLQGPLLIAFSQDEPGAAARLFRDFIKEHDNRPTVTMLSASGKVLPPEALNSFANLPTREQALSMLLGVLQAPIQQCASTLLAVPSQVVRVIAAVGQQSAAGQPS